MKNILSTLKNTFISPLFWGGLIVGALLVLLSPSKKAPKSTDPQTRLSKDFEYKYVAGKTSSAKKILLVKINGVIMNEKSADRSALDIFETGAATYGYSIKESLKRATNDPEIKGVLLEISSPGGAIPGTVAISEGVEYFRQKTKKPIIAHVIGSAASGAYWSAVSTDYIIADPGSITGSIGVIMGPFKYYNKVMDEGGFSGSVNTRDGIDYTYFTAGKYKDTGSPYRKLTPEEVTHWQKSIDNEYKNFVGFVSKRRKIPEETVRNVITALPYENERAEELHLIDKVGSREDALNELAKRTKTPISDYEVIQEKSRVSFFDDIFSSIEKIKPAQASKVCQLCNTPLVLYDPDYSLVNGL